jgi:translation initiation factor 2B subunit (eIF-2B alpha/beta/delta family)
MSETVLTALRAATGKWKHSEILVTESRPNNGGMTTAIRLGDHGVPVTARIDAWITEQKKQLALLVCGAGSVLEDRSAIYKT